MALRGLIVGIALGFSATVFTSAGWSQSQSNRKGAGYDLGSYADHAVDYNAEIKKSVESLKSEAERLAMDHILADLATKSSSEIFGLKLATDVCQEIACRGASPDAAHRYVEAYAEHQTALRNAVAAGRSVLIAASAAIISLLSLLITNIPSKQMTHQAA